MWFSWENQEPIGTPHTPEVNHASLGFFSRSPPGSLVDFTALDRTFPLSPLDPARRQHLKQLALYLAGVAVPPALWRGTQSPAADPSLAKSEEHWLTGGKPLFSRTPLKKLQQERPEVVFLGDSMVRAWIDAPTLSQLSGRRVSTLWQANSTSARWYLMFKNYVVRSEIRPRCVVLVFRNAFWHLPAYKVDGPFWHDLERCMPEMNDPVVSRILGDHRRRDAGRLHRFIDQSAFPIQSQRESITNRLEDTAAWLTRQDPATARALANDRLGFTRFRQDISVETGYHSGLQEAPFTRDPAKTFLPHVLSLARREGLNLFLLRIKRRPVSGSDSPDSPEMAAYIRQLSAYFAAENVPFHDFTPDPAISESMYAEGDHLDVSHAPWFSRHLHQVIGQAIFA